MHRIDNILVPKNLSDFTLYCISNSPQRFKEFRDYIGTDISGLNLEYFDGTDAENYSSLVNRAICSASTEIVLICSDRMRLKVWDVFKIVRLIERGYGFVGHRFYMFGIRKELVRKIGFLEEGFYTIAKTARREDDDFYIRLVENDISMWLCSDIALDNRLSTWLYDGKEKINDAFVEKWNELFDPSKYPQKFIRKRQDIWEEKYRELIGPSVPYDFLPYSESIISYRHLQDLTKKAAESFGIQPLYV